MVSESSLVQDKRQLTYAGAAVAIEAAVDAVIERGVLTRDLGGSANTNDVTAAVLDVLAQKQQRVAA